MKEWMNEMEDRLSTGCPEKKSCVRTWLQVEKLCVCMSKISIYKCLFTLFERDVHKNIFKLFPCCTNQWKYYFLLHINFEYVNWFYSFKNCLITQFIFQYVNYVYKFIVFLFHCNHLGVNYCVTLKRKTRHTHTKIILLVVVFWHRIFFRTPCTIS